MNAKWLDYYSRLARRLWNLYSFIPGDLLERASSSATSSHTIRWDGSQTRAYKIYKKNTNMYCVFAVEFSSMLFLKKPNSTYHVVGIPTWSQNLNWGVWSCSGFISLHIFDSNISLVRRWRLPHVVLHHRLTDYWKCISRKTLVSFLIQELFLLINVLKSRTYKNFWLSCL